MRWIVVFSLLLVCNVHGLLFPQRSESREIIDLSGFWKFRADYDNIGFKNGWSKGLPQPYIMMPVPSSFNDVTQNNSLRTFFGWVWYETTFFVPKSWVNQRIVLRFESAQYYAQAFVNGVEVVTHVGGHLPFEVEIPYYANQLVVAVNNTLSPFTLPPGEVVIYPGDRMHPPGYTVQNTYFDFFNYAGLNRPVKLYTTPKNCWIQDITITYALESATVANVYYTTVLNQAQCFGYVINLYNALGSIVATSSSLNGTLRVTNAQLWSPNNPYLYKFEVQGDDFYRLDIGIRVVEVKGNSFLINNQPFYFRGVDKHEDADVRGAGLDYVILAKDYNLLKWMNVNSYRTSHNPYAEEFYQWADREGIVIIDESPAVGLAYANFYNPTTLQHHKNVMQEIINRDKNHPSVVMWSVANEPNLALSQSYNYFQQVINFTKSIDPTKRPVTLVNSADYDSDNNVNTFVDLLCVNRYYAWYTDSGHLELIGYQLENDLRGWYTKYKKPIIMSEYGADTLSSIDRDPAVMFSQSFQVEFLQHYWAVFDKLRSEFFIGELIWNFADFATVQGVTRVGARNLKGVMTRQREPKPAAYALKERYQSLATNNSSLPDCQIFEKLSQICSKE